MDRAGAQHSLSPMEANGWAVMGCILEPDNFGVCSILLSLELFPRATPKIKKDHSRSGGMERASTGHCREQIDNKNIS
jgi:hypothetical protein